MMYYSRSASRKQTSLVKNSTTTLDDASPGGNETDGGSLDVLNMSTSREDLSRGASRCSCYSGESGNLKNDSKDDEEHIWTSANLKLELDQNGSEDELLKDELLRIFDREKFGLENYFKQKTERILQGYRRKQCDWEERVRLEKIEYEKSLAQEKIEVQQNYISEMTKLTKQFNQERVELESHYKKQISELTHHFEMRKKEMDETIIKERTELKQRLELEYQSMLKAQQTADQQQFRRRMSELEEDYKKKIHQLEQKLKESTSESDLAGRKIQSDLEAKFENEKALLVVEWRKRVELLELELGKEKERANKEERKVVESHEFLRNEVIKKESEIERLRQTVEALKGELSEKEKSAKDFEMLQQNIFLRGSEALPGKLRDDFEKMLAVHRRELELALKKEGERLETERERRVVLERETLEKQVKMEREKMALDLEKERSEMRRICHEKEVSLREEIRREMGEMKRGFRDESNSLREQVKDELGKERMEIGERLLREKDEREKQFKKVLNEEEKRRERDEYELWVSNQKMEQTKQWVEGHRGVIGDPRGSMQDNDVLMRTENNHVIVVSDENMEKAAGGNHRTFADENNVTNVTVNMENDGESRAFEEENQGLKAKIAALHENIRLHKCYKIEASNEIERLRKTNEELKAKMEEMKAKLEGYEERLEDYEDRLEDREGKIEEYERICEDYEKDLKECREKILVIEKDRESSTVIRHHDASDRQRSVVKVSRKTAVSRKDGKRQEIRSERRGSRNEDDDEDMEVNNNSMVYILQTEKTELERVIQDLENKIHLLETKINEISMGAEKGDKKAEEEQKRQLKSNLVKVQRQNRDLVNKIKDLQFQLQGMVDKLRKEKKKVVFLQKELHSFKSMHQSETKELQGKLECSGRVIERLQNTSAESDVVSKLQSEISAISKLMMEERLNEQRMIKARSIEELNKVQVLDQEKNELEKKLYEAKLALDGYSSRLKQNLSYAEFTSSQLSLNVQNDTFLRDVRLSKTIEALGESQKTSLRQNERLRHEKKELQSCIARLCKSQEDIRFVEDPKLSLSSRSSSISSLSSSSSDSSISGLHGNRFSSTFSFLD